MRRNISAPKRPEPKTATEKTEQELHRAKDTLDRIWSIVEFDGRVPEELIEEIDQVIRAYRYGEDVSMIYETRGK